MIILMREVATLARLMHGFWVERHSVCSRSGCKCRQGERNRLRRYLVFRDESSLSRLKNVITEQ